LLCFIAKEKHVSGIAKRKSIYDKLNIDIVKLRKDKRQLESDIEKATVQPDNKEQRIEKVLSIHADNPEAPREDVAAQLGVSRTTLGNYLTELESIGRITKDGTSILVTDNGKVPA